MQVGTLNCQSRRRGTANKTLFIPIRHRRLTGRDPTVPQSRDWSPKAKCFKAAAESGVPGFSFMHLHGEVYLFFFVPR